MLACVMEKPFREKHRCCTSSDCSQTARRSLNSVQAEQSSLSWLSMYTYPGSFVCAAHLVKAKLRLWTLIWNGSNLESKICHTLGPWTLCQLIPTTVSLHRCWNAFDPLIFSYFNCYMTSLYANLFLLSHPYEPPWGQGPSLPCAHSVLIPKKNTEEPRASERKEMVRLRFGPTCTPNKVWGL